MSVELQDDAPTFEMLIDEPVGPETSGSSRIDMRPQRAIDAAKHLSIGQLQNLLHEGNLLQQQAARFLLGQRNA